MEWILWQSAQTIVLLAAMGVVFWIVASEMMRKAGAKERARDAWESYFLNGGEHPAQNHTLTQTGMGAREPVLVPTRHMRNLFRRTLCEWESLCEYGALAYDETNPRKLYMTDAPQFVTCSRCKEILERNAEGRK